ncbi:hypothetical protein Tome1A_03885 [Lactococcus lactis subsp. lactis]|uniref:pilin N-terminal domain-containing protein n=1 Tax=Lactococcus lactis TaxID=1358 RepID=UPI00300DEE14
MTKSSKLMGVLIVTLLLFLGFVSQKAFADSRLIIVKYGLSPGATGFSENQTTNDGLQINNLPLDNLGNELSVLSGIHYLVYEISPTGDGSELKATNPPPSSYTVLKEVADLATDSNGVASLSVSDGYYLIEEQTNPQKGLLKTALPLVIKAPVSGLNEVYIYPKSSVDKEKTGPLNKPKPAPKPIEVPKAPKSKDDSSKKVFGLLLKTGVASSLLLTSYGFVLFLIIICLKKRRKKEEEVK